MNRQFATYATSKPLVEAGSGLPGMCVFAVPPDQRRQRGAARPLLLGGIALLLAAVVWLQYSDTGPPLAGAVVKRSAATASVSPSAASGSSASASALGASAAQDVAVLELAPRHKLDAQEREAFAAHRWLPPPPPPVAPAPPPKPMAPPLPYRFVGKSRTEAGWSVFLARGEQTHIAIANTTLEGTYRIAAIAPPVMKLLYLPLNQEQTLDIGPESQ